MPSRSHTGFTLVELLVSIFIIGLMLGISVVSFSNFLRHESVSSDAASLAAALREARSRTLGSIQGLSYGVKIDTDKFTLFPGPDFSASTAETPILFGTGVVASTSLSVVLFQRVTGTAVASGTIDIRLSSDSSAKKTVVIQGTGLVSVQ